MTQGPGTTTRDRHIKKRSDFQRLTLKGRSCANRLLVLKTLPNALTITRFGLSVGKAVGNAVVRNRVKRQLRELTRSIPVKRGWDILIIARGPITGSRFADIGSAMDQLLRQARLAED